MPCNYGLNGFKVHSKLCLITRKTDKGLEYITQIGTGNYNEKTSTLYTDLSLITAKQEIGKEAAEVFACLLRGETIEETHILLVAPKCLQNKILDMIDEEIRHAKNGKDAYVGIKINSLTDKVIIEKLVEASQVGVKIEMIVRGICCLKVGISGVSENIEVRSIVGNFLEHSRIFYFFNDGEEELYMGSADWMPRNLDRRVESLFPVLDDELKKRVRHILDVELADTLKAHVLHADGNYEKVDRRGKAALSSQDVFCKEAMEAVPKPSHGYQGRVFIPAEPVE